MKYNRNLKGNELRKIDGRYESRYLHDSESVFNKINGVSNSFCLAKWYTVSIHIPTGQTHSCYHPRAHHIPLAEIVMDTSALHNTKYKKEQRKKMLAGARPEECNFCWQIEDSGVQLSDRAYRSKDVYEEGLVEEALLLGSSGNPNPRYVEVNFNQACNFRCSYCSPHLSTGWMQDIQQNGAFILENRWHNDLTWMKNELLPNNSPDNPYLLAFWDWLPKIYPTLQTFRMTGGEPLMDKNTFKMFDYVFDHPKENLHLSITSNCCPPGNQWDKFIDSLKKLTDVDAVDHFMLFCSLDSWGKQAEYIRNGMDFDLLYKNVTNFLANCSKHSLTFIITFNVLSYTGFYGYMENILKLRQEYSNDRQLVWFDVPQLSDPDFMNPKLMPEMVSELERTVKFMSDHAETEYTEFKGFSDFEVSKVRRLIDWIKADTGFNKALAMKNFYMFWTEHDRRRGTDFHEVFPELTEFWDNCSKE